MAHLQVDLPERLSCVQNMPALCGTDQWRLIDLDAQPPVWLLICTGHTHAEAHGLTGSVQMTQSILEDLGCVQNMPTLCGTDQRRLIDLDAQLPVWLLICTNLSNAQAQALLPDQYLRDDHLHATRRCSCLKRLSATFLWLHARAHWKEGNL